MSAETPWETPEDLFADDPDRATGLHAVADVLRGAGDRPWPATLAALADLVRCRQALSRRHIRIRIARKGIESSERLGRHQEWLLEQDGDTADLDGDPRVEWDAASEKRVVYDPTGTLVATYAITWEEDEDDEEDEDGVSEST